MPVPPPQYDPMGHDIQMDVLSNDSYVPGEHGEHCVDPAADQLPGAHSAILVVFAQYDPAGQGCADDDPDGQYFPNEQIVTFDPPLQKYPAAHTAHESDDVSPAVDPNVPGAHGD